MIKCILAQQKEVSGQASNPDWMGLSSHSKHAGDAKNPSEFPEILTLPPNPTPVMQYCLFVFGATTPQWARASSFTRFLDHTQRRSRQNSSGRVISSSHRHLPYNTQHSQRISMPPMGFEPTISAGERPQTYALDRAASGTGYHVILLPVIYLCMIIYILVEIVYFCLKS